MIIESLCQLALNLQAVKSNGEKVLIVFSSGMGLDIESEAWEMLQRLKLSTKVVSMKGFNEAETVAYLKHSNSSFKLQDILCYTGCNPLLLYILLCVTLIRIT